MEKTFNKADLVDRVTASLTEAGTVTTKKLVGEVITEALNSIQAIIADEDQLKITGFGTFSGVHVEAGEARNPSTGEKVAVAAHTAPKFKYSGKFKDQLR